MKKKDLLYVSSTFFPDQSRIGDVLGLCEREGLLRIELGSNHSYDPDPVGAVTPFNCTYLVHNYFPAPEESFVLNIASLDDTVYQCSMDHVYHAIEYCERINAPLYTFHPGFLTDPDGSNTDSLEYDFRFVNKRLNLTNYEKAFGRIVDAVSRIVPYARDCGIRVAVETQGSVTKKEHLLMQRPEEYRKFFGLFSPKDIGINLNIGHLKLASNAFGFGIADFVNLVSEYIVAMELSHNDGEQDEHRPLMPGEWYWEIINDSRFDHVYKILEFRDTPIDSVIASLSLLENSCGDEVPRTGMGKGKRVSPRQNVDP